MLGVTQSLNREAVDALFGFAAQLPTGSELVFSFAPADHPLEVERGEVFRFWPRPPLGEPWKSRLPAGELVAQLADLAFSDIFHLTPELARQRYFADQPEIRRAELGSSYRSSCLISSGNIGESYGCQRRLWHERRMNSMQNRSG